MIVKSTGPPTAAPGVGVGVGCAFAAAGGAWIGVATNGATPGPWPRPIGEGIEPARAGCRMIALGTAEGTGVPVRVDVGVTKYSLNTWSSRIPYDPSSVPF